MLDLDEEGGNAVIVRVLGTLTRMSR